MHAMTKQNLQNAFAGESQAHMKYVAFAAVAEKEGKPNVARLFKAIAYAEQVHAINHLRVLGGVGSTAQNLAGALGGETFEIEEMYPVYHSDAQLQGETDAVRSTHYALEAEKIHAQMYESAGKVVDAGKDVDVGAIYICEVCGYTVEGEAPEFCPVCGAKHEKFKAF